MADLSVPTLAIVTNIRGGASVKLNVISLTVDESKGDSSRVTLVTLTAPPAWYANVTFPVNGLNCDVMGDRIFTGYVTDWRRAKLPDEWVIEAVDVLYVAENEWLVPEAMDTMIEYTGLVSDLVTTLLGTTCGYATLYIGNIPYTLGPTDPFEYGFESVLDLINRLNGILQTEIWADQDGGVHWDWASDFPDDNFGVTCSVTGATQGGLFYYNRTPGNVWSDIGASCGPYLAAMNAEYSTYNTAQLVLAEHRQHNYPGETASRPTRGNLLSWDQAEDEDTYRVGAVVFGLPPIKAEVSKGAFPYAPLASLNNVAIVSSALIQEQWIAESVAQNLSEQATVKQTVAWEAIGNTRYHPNVDHFVDTIEYFGYGNVTSVTHTVDSNGYVMRGESRIGYGPIRPGVNQAVVEYDEHILSADVGGNVERCTLHWEMPVTFDAASSLWQNDQPSFTYTHAWSDISSPSWTSAVHEVAFVNAPKLRPHPITGVLVATEGYGIAINLQGIWVNYWVASWLLTTVQIAAQWTLTLDASTWGPAAVVAYAAGLVTCIQADGADSRWPDYTFTPSMTHFCIHEPDFMLENGIIRFGVLAGGMEYYAGPVGGWIPCKHIFLFRATLGDGGLSNLQCIGALHGTAGAGSYFPWDGWWGAFAGWSYTDYYGTSLIWARPLNYSFGAACYSMEANVMAVTAALDSHGGYWHDTNQRFNHLVDARWGLCSTSGNSVRGWNVKRIVAGGGVADIDTPTIGGGSLTDWRGVSLWGGIEYGNLLTMGGTIEDTAFGRWVDKWEGGGAPFVVNWWEPWLYLIYLVTTDGKVYMQSRSFETPRAPGDLTTPEGELWDTWFANLGSEVLDSSWNTKLDWGGTNFSQECPYLTNPYTAAFYVNGNRFFPFDDAGGTPRSITKRGSTIYNFTCCGRGRKRVVMLYSDGSTCDELAENPPCCKKAEDNQCCGEKPLQVTDGASATDVESAGITTVRF